MAVKQLSDGGPDGALVGQSRSDLVAFYGTTPISQRAAAAQATASSTAPPWATGSRAT